MTWDSWNDFILEEPEEKRMIGDNRKITHINISFLFSLRIKIAGLAKKVIHKILKLYVPIKDRICNISKFLEKLNAIKFQGKPVKILPLRNSVRPNRSENKNKLLKGFFILIIKKQ